MTKIVDLPLFIIEPTILLSILYFMVGLNPAVDRFFMAVVIVLLVVQVVVSLGKDLLILFYIKALHVNVLGNK